MDEWLIAEVNALSEPSSGFRQTEVNNDGATSSRDAAGVGAGQESGDYLVPPEKRPKLEFCEEQFDYLGEGSLFGGTDASAASLRQLDNLKSELATYATTSTTSDAIDAGCKQLAPMGEVQQNVGNSSDNQQHPQPQTQLQAHPPETNNENMKGEKKEEISVQKADATGVREGAEMVITLPPAVDETVTNQKDKLQNPESQTLPKVTENVVDAAADEDGQKPTKEDSTKNKKKKKAASGSATSSATSTTTTTTTSTTAGGSQSQNMRKNIRDILTDDKLESETLAAQREEMERKRRLQEIQQRAHQEMMAQQAFLRHQERQFMAAGLVHQRRANSGSGGGVGSMHHHQQHHQQQQHHYAGTMPPPIRYGQPMGGSYISPSAGSSGQMRFRQPNDVILLESSSSGSSDEESLNKSVIDISSSDSSSETTSSDSDSDDDDDIVAVCGDLSDDDGKEGEDPNNSGSHVNDTFNQPDASGRVLVNVGHPIEDPDIFLAPQLARVIKPHQIGGIRFLYDNIVESLSSWKTSNGFGCILAHSMGLGKTIQVVSFVDVFLRNTEGRTVLIIVPINTLQNWIYEFNMWTPPLQPQPQTQTVTTSPSMPQSVNDVSGRLGEGEIRCRNFVVHALSDLHKTPYARARVIRTWQNEGGVLLIGYEMYRIICSRKSAVVKMKRGRKAGGSEAIMAAMMADMKENEKNKEYINEMQQNLLKPDLVICDEGHRIKNCHASTSQALKNIKTKRRVVLTGYPLQNNLIEYWCMVDFVRPNFLGTKSEFCNMFERPIQNGQCVDSTPEDVRLMRYRAHVLHSLLEGFIQRRGHSVLRLTLPQKHEHVLLVRMTSIQRTLYSTFMQELLSRNTITNPIKAFSVCCKIWNHPDILYNCVRNLQSKGLEDDLDLEEARIAAERTTQQNGSSPSSSSSSRRSKNVSPVNMGRHVAPVSSAGSVMQNFTQDMNTNMDAQLPPAPSSSGMMDQDMMGFGSGGSSCTAGSLNKEKISESGAISYDWAHAVLKDYRPGVLENGLKMVLMLQIIEQGLQAGDRILLFSQSLFTLSLIEELLGQLPVPCTDGSRWARNKNYFRLDGSTSSSEREKLINDFNSNTSIALFLISTRAGSLGINLVGANRVIVFDASWNPCHDTQAVCRVYRYGQIKPCHVYRFVTDNSLEKKIYDRQINKQGMSDRIVDELNPDVTLTMKEVSNLLVANESDPPIKDLSESAAEYDDHVLRHLCTSVGHCLTRPPFEHESQLMDRKELKLTKMEKRLAKQSYEMDKKATVHFRYPRSDPFTMDYGHSGRPVANVRPMQFNNQRPSPMDALAKQGVTFKQIHLTNEVRIPAPNGKDEPIVIPAGQQVMIISSPNGVYLRCPNNKLVLIKPPGQQGQQQHDSPQLAAMNGMHQMGSRPHAAMHSQGTMVSNRTGGGLSEEAEVIDLSDEDDDIIVTSTATTPTTSSMSFPPGRSVIMSSGNNAYTAQNPGLLAGGLVLRNEPSGGSRATPVQPIVSSNMSVGSSGQQQQLQSSSSSSSTSSYSDNTRTISSLNNCFDQLLTSSRDGVVGRGIVGKSLSNYGSNIYGLNPQLTANSSSTASATSISTSISSTGISASVAPNSGTIAAAATTTTTSHNSNNNSSSSSSSSDMSLSAMDYLNKTLSTPSYNPYPPWGSTFSASSGGGNNNNGGNGGNSSSSTSSASSVSSASNWGTMPVHNPSPAADQVAFVSSIRDLLIPARSRLFPTPTSRPELVTAPLSAKHLGDLYPHVLDATAAAATGGPVGTTNNMMSYYDQQHHHHHHHQPLTQPALSQTSLGLSRSSSSSTAQ